MKTLRLKPGRERSLLRRHPWVFDGAIAKGGGDRGETVRVESAEGRFLAWAACSPASNIRARVWSFDEKARIDASFFVAACGQSVRARSLFHVESNALRLVHAEADGLPGLVVDRYGDLLVAQFGAAGVERWKDVIADALLQATGCKRLYERSDASARQLEGLPEVTGWLRGGPADVPEAAAGTDDAAAATVQENGMRFAIHAAQGHKTGFYLDQRDNRRKFRDELARRKAAGLPHAEVLNCYCYTGGFTVAALQAGATQVLSVDSSGPALAQAADNVALNGLDASACTWLDADVNATLRRLLAQGRQFDAIVLDPPKLAPTSAHAERAARAYKDINRLGLQLLRPGGLMHTYSCSGGVSADLFHKIVAGAGADAGVDGYITERLAAAPDHPMTLEFPEGEYLKGLAVVRKAG